MSLEPFVEKAKAGDRAALEEVIAGIQSDVFRLAMRMLWHPQDAEDATQEILIRVITNLGSFRGESAFNTWVYRVASNYLLTSRKRRMEQQSVSFEEFGKDLADGLSHQPVHGFTEAEQKLLIEEVKIGCTQAMLLCLDRDHRLTYILGEIMELTSAEATEILEITPVAFRKRLQRGRSRIAGFMQQHCGLVKSDAACRCDRRVKRAIELGRVVPGNLLFAESAPDSEASVEQYITQLEELRGATAVMRSNPQYFAPEQLAASIHELVDSVRK